MQYKNKWQPNSLNKEFWEEVLVGRTIKSLEFEEHSLKCIVLDNNEKIYPYANTIGIISEDNEFLEADDNLYDENHSCVDDNCLCSKIDWSDTF